MLKKNKFVQRKREGFVKEMKRKEEKWMEKICKAISLETPEKKTVLSKDEDDKNYRYH